MSYTIADSTDQIEVLKKYAKLLYIPILYYLIKDEYVKNKCINFFLTGCGIILLFSYAKYLNIIDPSLVAEYLDIRYQSKLLPGVTVFQHSIVHGIVLSFFSYLMAFRFSQNKNLIFLLISILGFCNVIFLNNSRAAYITAIILIFIAILKFVRKPKTKILILLITFLTLTFGILNNNTFKHRISSALNEFSYYNNNEYINSIGLRLFWAKIGLYNLSKSPLYGTGVGSFRENSINYLDKHNLNALDNYSDIVTPNPHNEFISISTQLGLMGLLIYTLFLLYLFIYSFGTDYGIAVFAIISTASFSNTLFYDNILGIFIILIITLGISYKNHSN